MPDQLPLTIHDAAAALRSGTVTSVELTTTYLKRINATQSTLGAFVTLTEEAAMEAATAADSRLASGVDHGPLTGIPLAVKDIIATKDAPTTANSRILDPEWGRDIDAPVVARLRDAGAVILGKSTTHEFAVGMPDPDMDFLIPHNPWNTDHTPAGSSSGNGIAVAAGLALGALGTDTGGSVRGPAAANGCTGLKVTFGRVPKNGVVPLAYSLDSVGPMARSAYDCALLLQVLAGYDPGDPFAATQGVPNYAAELNGSVEGLRIGVPKPYFFDVPELDDETRTAVLRAVDVLAQMGAIIEDTVVLDAKEAKETNNRILHTEGFAYHRNDLANRWSDYGRHTRMALICGAFTSAADYLQAQHFRSHFRRVVAQLFSHFDVLITPGALGPAARVDQIDLDRRSAGPSFTGQWNLAGLPAVVVPCGHHSNGLPLPMQIVGRPFAEGTVLRVADAFQRQSDWHLRMPQVTAVVAT